MAKRKLTVEEQAQQLLDARKVSRGRPKKWENYTAAEKVIAIGYDVIQSILAGIYSPTPGDYVSSDSIKKTARAMGKDEKSSLQELIPHLVGCEVCQLGAAFLSLVRFENRCTIAEGTLEPADFNGSAQGRSRLAEIIGDAQLFLMEAAFEGSWLVPKPNDVTAKQMDKALDFYDKHADDTALSLAIWINTIKNNGVFKP